jgi:hypothetical protein
VKDEMKEEKGEGLYRAFPRNPKSCAFVSFVGFSLLTKSLLCNVDILNRDAVLFRISSLLEFISLRWKEPYYDKFQCYKVQEGYFRVLGRFCADSNSEQVGSFVSL